MKTFLQLLLIGFFFAFSTINAQNLVLNPDLESWTAGVPDNWPVYENITQESGTVHGGSSSAKHTSASSTKDFNQVVGGIQEGQEYIISYWYYDNDPSARTRIWAYWKSGGSNLPDNEDELRSNDNYSIDTPSWQQFSVTLNAPATADEFKFEVRVYNQDGNVGGAVYYDDFVFSGEVIVNPEPSNYPTSFMATANGITVDLSWIDAIGAQLPTAYIILAGTSSSLPVPVDGTPIPNDTDLSDGSGALNVNFGEEAASFLNLNGNTTYYFSIYSYSNLGPNIDYKTDGTAPTANASTSNVTVIESENFDASWGNWSVISLAGGNEWDRDNTFGVGDTPCASATGYLSGSNPPEYEESDDWLISPAMNFNEFTSESIVFFNTWNYTGPDMEFKISTNYDGGGDPSIATWTILPFNLSPGGWDWTSSGEIDLSSYSGAAVYVAFHFTSSTLESATWEVDDILITGEVITSTPDLFANPAVSVYPNPADEIVRINQTSEFFNRIEIKGISGRTIKTFELAGLVSRLNLSDLSSGVYFLVFIDEENGNTHSEKLIIR